MAKKTQNFGKTNKNVAKVEPKLQSNSKSKAPLLIFLFMLLALYALSTTFRLEDRTAWKLYPGTFYVGETPMVHTLDAYKWVRLADEYRNGLYDTSIPDEKMYYPDYMARAKPIPMLSLLLAWVAPYFNGNLYEAGLFLIPFLAGLFIIPLGLYFYRLGHPIAGLVAGFCGTFAYMYYLRTGPGRIDTDALNIFFPLLASYFILLASQSSTKIKTYIFALLTGISMLLFHWWYEHSLFTVVYLFVLIAALFVNKKGYKAISISSVLYIVSSNPFYFFRGFSDITARINSYLMPKKVISGGFPNVYETVSEVSRTEIMDIISTSFIHPLIFVIAAASLCMLVYRRYKEMIPLSFFILMGLLSFTSSMRLLMYLVPVLGMGLGYLISYTINLLKNEKLTDNMKTYFGYAVISLLFVIIFFLPGHSFIFTSISRPSISPAIYTTFKAMKQKLPDKSAVYTWWDYGLAIEAEVGAATFHDGMCQNSGKTWFIAQSLLADQQTLSKNMAMIANEGMRAFSNSTSAEIVDKIKSYDKPLVKENIYLTFTEDMLHKLGAIQKIGSWDMLNSSYGYFAPMQIYNCLSTSIGRMDCKINNTINTVDLNVGTLNSVPVGSINFVNLLNGTTVLKNEKNNNSNIHLIVLVAPDNPNSADIIQVDTKLYNSAFVQLYILGNYDPELYEEVINYYPFNRTFKLLSKR